MVLRVQIALSDYLWVTGPDARSYFAQAESHTHELQLASGLRKALPAERARLILEQVNLRIRARDKFAHADRMFFTRKSLEQATDSIVAAYKADRFRQFASVADLCCGIGGDLIEIARHTNVLGIELEGVTSLIARANCDALHLGNSRVECQDALKIDVREFAAWHIDPDRRPEGVRTTSLEAMRPTGDDLRALLERNRNGAIKLAPGSHADEDWLQDAELQWIGHQRSAQQLVAWFGDLARHPGRRVATLLHGDQARDVIGKADEPVNYASEIKGFIHEPHAAVLAAGLAGSLANEHGLEAVIPRCGYLTSNDMKSDPALASFRVLEVVPFRARSIRLVLASHGAGTVEVKQRGVKIDVNLLQIALRSNGGRPLTVLVTRRGQAMIAIVAERVT